MFRMEIKTEDLERVVSRMPRAVRMQVGDALDHVGRKFLKIWRQERLQGPPGVKSRPRGIFSQFVRQNFIPSGDKGMGMVIFTNSGIAQQHEEGATVTAEDGGKLAVPLSARGSELFTQSGKIKKTYRNLRGKKNIVPIKFGNDTYLTKVKRRSREVLPLFILKQSIRIKPRLGFYAVWERNLDNFYQIIAKRMAQGVVQEWEKNG